MAALALQEAAQEGDAVVLLPPLRGAVVPAPRWVADRPALQLVEEEGEEEEEEEEELAKDSWHQQYNSSLICLYPP